MMPAHPPSGIAINPDQFGHVSIRASAGSGKTFQLINRYLQLVAAGAEPSSILATTFTRLAAGQIRDRILMRLAEAADDPKKLGELAGHLGAASLSREALLDLLGHLARRLHQLQIRTLDSFFASVVRAFAIELDIPVDAEVADESQARQMRAEAIRLMLDERQPQQLVELLRLLTQGSSERGVMQTIDRTVTGLYALYREAADDAWDGVPRIPTLGEDQVNAAVEMFRQYCPPADKTWAKAHATAIERAWARDWAAFISSGLAEKIITGQPKFGKKPIDVPVIAAYQPLIEHARGVLIGRVRDQTIATREMLRLYHEQHEAVKHRRRIVTFDDLAAAMAKAQQIGKLDEIGFRIDARLRHLLLDEFQDTSVPQWRALEPIARELVSYAAPQRTLFCVGDVKQSIYGWRDAAPEVLDELPNLLIGPDGASAIRQIDLARSYRSSQVVIDVVNEVFESLSGNAALADFPDAVEAWSAGFKHHETARKDLPGYAELRTARRAEEGQDKNAIRYEQAAALAADLHHGNGDLKIAILTRSNKAVARLMYELGPSRRNVPTSGRGGGPLTDAPAVNAVLDLLQLADHPDDTTAAFNVANSPLGAVIGLTDHADTARRHAVAHDVRRKLVGEGYSKTIAEWVRSIAGACDVRELRRLLQLAQLAATHDARSTLRTHDFIELVEQTNVSDVQPAPVQVMTIHQSKGLEFDVVILPELEASVIGERTPPVVFDREQDTGPITAICRYMNEDTLALVPQLRPLFERHRRRTVRENLSVLYVAMTRAIYALYMITDPPAENEKKVPQRLSGVLRSALSVTEIEPQQLVYWHGDRDWMQGLPAPKTPGANDQPVPAATPPLAPAPRDWRMYRGVATDSPSALVQRRSPLALQLHLPDAEPRDRGHALHTLFEQIEWVEDFQVDEYELLRIAQAAAPRRPPQWARAQVDLFLNSIRALALQQVLARGDDDPALLRLYREHPFARIVDGAIQSGVLDRLVVKLGPDGTARSATVIDFKTDEVGADNDLAAHAEAYRPQLQVYRGAAARMLGVDPKDVAMRLVFIAAGAGVDL